MMANFLNGGTLTIPMDSRKASIAFKAIVEKLGRDDVLDILFNWDDCELSDDGTNIIQYVGRDREYTRGKEGGKVKANKKDFLIWLLSDAPFNEQVYGSAIRQDTTWVKRIESARAVSGLSQDISTGKAGT